MLKLGLFFTVLVKSIPVFVICSNTLFCPSFLVEQEIASSKVKHRKKGSRKIVLFIIALNYNSVFNLYQIDEIAVFKKGEVYKKLKAIKKWPSELKLMLNDWLLCFFIITIFFINNPGSEQDLDLPPMILQESGIVVF